MNMIDFETRPFVLFSLVCCVSLIYHVNGISSEQDEWSYLVFAQRWPTAACYDLPHGEKCALPEGVSDWIIHGLWPTSLKGYPSFCNSSWSFTVKAIQSVEKELEISWPNIISGKDAVSFWKHEWSKHGTCAVSVEALNSQLKYFNTTLELHNSFNLLKILQTESIIPKADYGYLFEDIKNAFKSQLNTTAKIFCKKNKAFEYPLMDTIYLCMDKEFQLIDCDIPKEPDCSSTYVMYLPLLEKHVLHEDL